MTLKTEFEEFVALTLDVESWEIGFGLAIRGTNHIGGLESSALKLTWRILSNLDRQRLECGVITFISTWLWVRVDRIDIWVVAGLAVCGVRAV
jgi:hypothetical protein